jgi:hypothetical protein
MSTSSKTDDGPVLVSISELVRNPDRYFQKRVRVVGFCSMAFEAKGLFTSDYRQTRTLEGIWLDVPISEESRRSHERWVTAEGAFDGTQHGHGGMYAGTLHVEKLEPRDGQAAEGSTR